MEMNPQAIRNTGFRLVKKGYDADQVDAFKDQIADIVEAAQSQATAMEARARAAVTKLQELSHGGSQPRREHEPMGADENDVLSRTLLLAQRTADSAVAEARAEADSIRDQSRDEAERILDGARMLAAKTIEDSRAEARRAVEGDRVRAENDVQSLLARREFLLSDVDHLEHYLQAQRERIRDAAVGLQELIERVPGGLGEIRRPLLSAADHEAAPAAPVAPAAAASAAIAAPVLAPNPQPDHDPEQEASELVWDEAAAAAAEQMADDDGGPSLPPATGSRAGHNRGREASPRPFSNDPREQDDVWRLLDEEVAITHGAQGGFQLDEITTEVPIQPRIPDSFQVGGDELQ
ncbi:MAG: DivIVA domain-containing protein [Actinobacteria bacterium]|nr:DivIVA domain-containing protein [Actinomycetota bacterium]